MVNPAWTLDRPDRDLADDVARQKKAYNEANKIEARNGNPYPSLAEYVLGERGEVAFARLLDLEYRPEVGVFPPWDFGLVNVKARKPYVGFRPDLIILPHAPPGGVYALMIPDEDRVRYELFGWIYGWDGKDRKYWKEVAQNGRPAFFVPIRRLERDWIRLREWATTDPPA